MQVEKQPGQPATIVVGVQLLDREHYVRLNLPEFANALLYGQIAYSQAHCA